jgi:hypothetical protein
VLLAAIGLLALAGCGPRSDRLAVSGTVTLNGEPLSGGSIHFTSLGEQKLASGAMIENGEYHIPQEKGLLPGEYHLEISAPDTDSPPVMIGGSPTAPELIPPEYNVDSKKTIQVTTDGDNHFEFEIAVRPAR